MGTYSGGFLLSALLFSLFIGGRGSGVACRSKYLVLATQDFSKASKAGIADTLIGSTSTKIVSKVIGSDAKRLTPSMRTSTDFLTGLSDHSFGFFSGEEPAIIRTEADPLFRFDKHSSLSLVRQAMEYHYGPAPEEDEEPTTKSKTAPDTHSGEPEAEETETAEPLAEEAKAKTPKQKPSMSKNEDQDIEPSDQL